MDMFESLKSNLKNSDFGQAQESFLDIVFKAFEIQIVRGVEDLYDDFQECCAIYRDGKIVGSGVLVGNRKILTAKHILWNSNSNYSAVFGHHDVTGINLYQPSSIHEVFSFNESDITRERGRDLATVTLRGTPSATPVNYKRDYRDVKGQEILTVGYGCHDDSSRRGERTTWGKRRFVCGKIMDREVVRQFPSVSIQSKEFYTLFCSDWDDNYPSGRLPLSTSRICKRDSGGPAYAMINNNKVLIGVTYGRNRSTAINIHTKIK